MTIKKITVPDLGEASEVEVIELLVNVGEKVKENDSLLVLESDKAAMEIPCLLYTSPSPRDYAASRMPSSA